MKTYVFPGQGSQVRGMGAGLFDEFPDLTEKADDLLGYSIKELCLNDANKELGKTQYTQPALYVVNALSYYKRIRDTAETPDYLAGHSLGEFNALLAAGCFDFETGLDLVAKRGELMSQATEGAMAAIVNVTRDTIESVLKESGFDRVELANVNAPDQVVISGPAADIAACQDLFRFGNAKCIRLNTSGAFHSRLMHPSQERFENYLKGRTLSDPKIPVIANLTARPYPGGAIVEYLSKQVCSAVLWSDTIQYLMSLSDTMAFVQIGPRDVLTKLTARIKQHAEKAAMSGDPVALAEEKVAAWNRRHRIGTKATSAMAGYGALITRTPAMVLFGHRAAIYMEEYKGYFDLDEIRV